MVVRRDNGIIMEATSFNLWSKKFSSTEDSSGSDLEAVIPRPYRLTMGPHGPLP
jgi:hypothetical protein